MNKIKKSYYEMRPLHLTKKEWRQLLHSFFFEKAKETKEDTGASSN